MEYSCPDIKRLLLQFTTISFFILYFLRKLSHERTYIYFIGDISSVVILNVTTIAYARPYLTPFYSAAVTFNAGELYCGFSTFSSDFSFSEMHAVHIIGMEASPFAF